MFTEEILRAKPWRIALARHLPPLHLAAETISRSRLPIGRSLIPEVEVGSVSLYDARKSRRSPYR
jgi:hypothetical protein